MKKKNGILILVIIGILVICSGIGFAAKKAYDRHKEELRLQAIETKNSEIDAEYQKFENEENRDKKLEALKQEVESAENYKKQKTLMRNAPHTMKNHCADEELFRFRI